MGTGETGASYRKMRKQNDSKPKLTSKTGESLNAGGEGSSGQVVVKPGETTSVKPEAAACCSPLPETVEAVLANMGN